MMNTITAARGQHRERSPSHALCLATGEGNKADDLVLHSSAPGGMPFHFTVHILLCLLRAVPIIRNHPIRMIVAQDPLVNGLVAWMLAIGFKRPLCVHCLSDFVHNRHHIPSFFMRMCADLIARIVLKAANAIRVTNDDMADKLISIGVDAAKIWIIPYTLDDYAAFNDRYLKAIGENTYRKERFADMVLMVGYLDDRYDLGMYFHAISIVVASHPRSLFLLVGESQSVTPLRRLADHWGIRENLIVSGWLEYEQLPACYAEAAMLAVPARYMKEAMLRPALLAAACGLPVVATDIDGIGEIIENGTTGFIVPPGDAPAFAEKISYLIENPEKSTRMGGRSRQRVASLLDERNAKRRYESMYAFVEQAGSQLSR